MTKNTELADPIRNALWERSGGICECWKPCDEHRRGRCPQVLRTSHWRPYRKRPDGAYEVRNLIAMCSDCHRNAEAREARRQERSGRRSPS